MTIAILASMSFIPFLMTLLNFVFGQLRFWKFLHGLVVAVPVETVRFERSIHFNDSNTSWVNLNIVSLYKPVSLTKIKVLCCLNVDDLLSRTLLLTIVTHSNGKKHQAFCCRKRLGGLGRHRRNLRRPYI